MTLASLVRLVGFAVPAAAAVVVLAVTHSLSLFLIALMVTLVVGVVDQRIFRRLASIEEQRRDLEDRVRNPPS